MKKTLFLMLALWLASSPIMLAQTTSGTKPAQHTASRTVRTRPYIDIEAADTAGVVHRLSEYVGHDGYVLLDFWASWCRPCMAVLPSVKAAYEQYHEKGLQIVSVSLDTQRTAWISTIRKHGMEWPNISDLKGWESAPAAAYGVRAIPAMLLIDPKGQVVASGSFGVVKQKLVEIYGD